MIDINSYWTRVKTKEKAEREGQAAREQKYALTGNVADLEGQDLHAHGLFLITLQNEERGTEGGGISSIPWKYVGQRLQDRTHRVATLAEITLFREQMQEHASSLRATEDRLNSRRSISVSLSEPSPRGTGA